MKREPKDHSEKFYLKRSKVLRGAGLTTIGLTTTGGFSRIKVSLIGTTSKAI